MRDVVIIGAGPGGYDTAIYAKEHGLDVVLIEKNTVGGTCLNWGCIPTKALYHNAEQIKHIANIQQFGIDIDKHQIQYEIIKQRKEQIVEAQINNIETTLHKLGIPLIRGEAQIKDRQTILVGDHEITTKNIIIATGSKVRRFPFKGDNLDVVHDSKELLSLTTFPKKMIVVGAGVIGSEMASIFNYFDCEVTVVEYLDDILPPLDKDIKKRARNLFKRNGIDIYTSSSVKEVQKNGSTYKAIIETKTKTIEVETDYVLLATGRIPNFGNLNLDQIGIEYSKQGIHVNANKQTNIPNIYAIGDVNGELMLAHKATYDGYKAVSHILNKDMPIRFDLVPSVVFSFPEIATIGKTEEDLIGREYKKNKFMYKTNAKAQCMEETDGFIKMLVDENDALVGCHIIGAHASDLIHEVASLMYTNITINEYKNIIHAHPTLSEVIGECIKGFH